MSAYDPELWSGRASMGTVMTKLNTLRPRRKGQHVADDIFKCIFYSENIGISIKISLKFVPMTINNILALVQIMASRRPSDKPLFGAMMVCFQRIYASLRVYSNKCIWVRSWMCGCLATWFCYHLIAKPGNKTAAPSWPGPLYATSVAFGAQVRESIRSDTYLKLWDAVTHPCSNFRDRYMEWETTRISVIPIWLHDWEHSLMLSQWIQMTSVGNWFSEMWFMAFSFPCKLLLIHVIAYPKS